MIEIWEIAARWIFVSAGVREYSLITFLPITSILLSTLHLLLGLGNNIFTNFKNFIVERVEKVLPEEKDTRNMTFLTKIKYEDAALLYFDSKASV